MKTLWATLARTKAGKRSSQPVEVDAHLNDGTASALIKQVESDEIIMNLGGDAVVWMYVGWTCSCCGCRERKLLALASEVEESQEKFDKKYACLKAVEAGEDVRKIGRLELMLKNGDSLSIGICLDDCCDEVQPMFRKFSDAIIAASQLVVLKATNCKTVRKRGGSGDLTPGKKAILNMDPTEADRNMKELLGELDVEEKRATAKALRRSKRKARAVAATLQSVPSSSDVTSEGVRSSSDEHCESSPCEKDAAVARLAVQESNDVGIEGNARVEGDKAHVLVRCASLSPPSDVFGARDHRAQTADPTSVGPEDGVGMEFAEATGAHELIDAASSAHEGPCAIAPPEAGREPLRPPDVADGSSDSAEAAEPARETPPPPPPRKARGSTQAVLHGRAPDEVEGGQHGSRAIDPPEASVEQTRPPEVAHDSSKDAETATRAPASDEVAGGARSPVLARHLQTASPAQPQERKPSGGSADARSAKATAAVTSAKATAAAKLGPPPTGPAPQPPQSQPGQAPDELQIAASTILAALGATKTPSATPTRRVAQAPAASAGAIDTSSLQDRAASRRQEIQKTLSTLNTATEGAPDAHDVVDVSPNDCKRDSWGEASTSSQFSVAIDYVDVASTSGCEYVKPNDRKRASSGEASTSSQFSLAIDYGDVTSTSGCESELPSTEDLDGSGVCGSASFGMMSDWSSTSLSASFPNGTGPFDVGGHLLTGAFVGCFESSCADVLERPPGLEDYTQPVIDETCSFPINAPNDWFGLTTDAFGSVTLPCDGDSGLTTDAFGSVTLPCDGDSGLTTDAFGSVTLPCDGECCLTTNAFGSVTLPCDGESNHGGASKKVPMADLSPMKILPSTFSCEPMRVMESLDSAACCDRLAALEAEIDRTQAHLASLRHCAQTLRAQIVPAGDSSGPTARS